MNSETEISANCDCFFNTWAYIDGIWCEADDGDSFAVDSPATGESTGRSPQ